MKKLLLTAVLLATSYSAFSADMISAQEAKHFKLVSAGNISVSSSGGQISSPSDLHAALSKLADEKGAKYYTIISAREHGNNFEAVAKTYK
ncbi:DUF1471 domain-containing protein [Rouxiella sp. WC2420]|uniref:DUF1471 domain-containing protein n=1 Tax=Rouxiella sp. WC2420 TaxID=3234145 RepID=A0AB39VUY3_9GAMM